MRNVPSSAPYPPATSLPSALLRTPTAGLATGVALLSAATMTPRTSPAAAGGCCPCGGPAGFWAPSETAARLRTRATRTNRMRFMGPALWKRWIVGISEEGGNPDSSRQYGLDNGRFQGVHNKTPGLRGRFKNVP